MADEKYAGPPVTATCLYCEMSGHRADVLVMVEEVPGAPDIRYIGAAGCERCGARTNYGIHVPASAVTELAHDEAVARLGQYLDNGSICDTQERGKANGGG